MQKYDKIKEGLKNFSDRKKSSIKILDVATGSGRTLKQLNLVFLRVFSLFQACYIFASIF